MQWGTIHTREDKRTIEKLSSRGSVNAMQRVRCMKGSTMKPASKWIWAAVTSCALNVNSEKGRSGLRTLKKLGKGRPSRQGRGDVEQRRIEQESRRQQRRSIAFSYTRYLRQGTYDICCPEQVQNLRSSEIALNHLPTRADDQSSQNSGFEYRSASFSNRHDITPRNSPSYSQTLPSPFV